MLGEGYQLNVIGSALLLLFQLDIFQLVGAPLVENCLAGFNSSVFAYGQVTLASYYVIC